MEELDARRRDAPVFPGADTHSEAHVGAALNRAGRRLLFMTVQHLCVRWRGTYCPEGRDTCLVTAGHLAP